MIRATPEERDKWQAQADEQGVPLSEWVRWVLRRGKKREVELIPVFPGADPRGWVCGHAIRRITGSTHFDTWCGVHFDGQEITYVASVAAVQCAACRKLLEEAAKLRYDDLGKPVEDEEVSDAEEK